MDGGKMEGMGGRKGRGRKEREEFTSEGKGEGVLEQLGREELWGRGRGENVVLVFLLKQCIVMTLKGC